MTTSSRQTVDDVPIGKISDSAALGRLIRARRKADGITLAPIRAGVGLRLGANVGYLSYSRKRNVIPL